MLKCHKMFIFLINFSVFVYFPGVHHFLHWSLFVSRSLCLSRTPDQQRNCLQENLKTVERKFPSSHFNRVYSCLCFLFPVLFNMLPAQPFLLFPHPHCPLLVKRRYGIVGTTCSQLAVTQEFPHRSETRWSSRGEGGHFKVWVSVKAGE